MSQEFREFQASQGFLESSASIESPETFTLPDGSPDHLKRILRAAGVTGDITDLLRELNDHGIEVWGEAALDDVISQSYNDGHTAALTRRVA